MKTCCECKIEKPLEMFSKNKTRKDGKTPQCKKCRSERNKKYRATTNAKNLKKINTRKLRTGFTAEYYNLKLIEQNNACAICGTNVPSGRGDFHADHCHLTKQTRGLLCLQCNAGLGQFKDNIENLKAAIEYLEYYKAQLEKEESDAGS